MNRQTFLGNALLASDTALSAPLIRAQPAATDINTPNFFGETPLDVAIERNYSESVELLRQNGGVRSK